MPRAALLAATALAASLATNVPACCGVGPTGVTVGFAEQRNIIVWDEMRQIQHFVRNASFDSNAKDFGFIAPTPTVPELAEANEEAFRLLASLKPAAPQIFRGPATDAAAPAQAVTVIKEQQVAGYDAAVLKSSDPEALRYWLRKNGYSATPDSTAWFETYVAKGWYFTAFKVTNPDPEDPAAQPQTGLVRISFSTPEPFNPYYVPADNRSEDASLSLYMVSTRPVQGTVDEKPWVEPKWSASLPETARIRLAEYLDLPVSAIPASAHVAYYVDRDFASPGAPDADIFFQTPAPNSTLLIVGALAALAVAGYIAFRQTTPSKPFTLPNP